MSDKLKKLPSVIEDCEVFEITDFTAVSPWEVFIAQLEEVIHEWHLTDRSDFKPVSNLDFPLRFETKCEKIAFDGHPFEVKLYSLQREEEGQESKSGSNDVASSEDVSLSTSIFRQLISDDLIFTSCDVHPIVKWYGLHEFVVISPAVSQPVKGPFRTRLLVSSVALAVTNTNCEVPIFVQMDDPRRQLYQGVADVGKYGSLRTEFKVAHLKQIPQAYCTVAGFMNMFREKLNMPFTMRLDVDVAAKQTYRVDTWPSEYACTNVITPGEGPTKQLHLPVGLQGMDPIAGLSIAITWPKLSKTAQMDISGASLVPTPSSLWSLKVSYCEGANCQLYASMKHFLSLCKRKESSRELLNTKRDATQQEPGKAFEKLTQAPVHRYGLHNLGRRALESAVSRFQPGRRGSHAHSGAEALPEDVLSRYLEYLFPDSLEQLLGVIPSPPSTEQLAEKEADHIYESLIIRLKAAPFSSLVHRLALSFLNLYANRDDSAPSLVGPPNAFMTETNSESDLLAAGLESGPSGGSPKMPHSSSFASLSSAAASMSSSGRRASTLSTDQLHRLQYVAHVWQELVMELRYRWDNGLDLWKVQPPQSDSRRASLTLSPEPASEANSKSSQTTNRSANPTEPNLAMCLLWQKMQMLQCCIERRAQRTKNVTAASSVHSKQKVEGNKLKSMETAKTDWDDWGDEDESEKVDSSGSDIEEQFFDAAMDMSQSRVSLPDVDDDPEAALLAEGRQERCGTLRLLHRPKQCLYVPVCQEASGPFTEDMVWSHAAQLQDLGTSTEAAVIRAKMQSASLLADMQAFKAANPGCCLEDFVRWYSPRDFEVAADGMTGVLSQRMQLPGNLWQESWDTAVPIPASKQKRIFDETKEGEEVLKYLEELNPAQVALHLLPSVVLEVCRTLLHLEDPALEEWKTWILHFSELASHMTAEHLTQLSTVSENLDAVSRRLLDLEYTMAACKSLRHKFELAAAKNQSRLSQSERPSEDYLNPLIQALLLGGKQVEVELEGGGFGPAMRDLRQLLVDIRCQQMAANSSPLTTGAHSQLDPGASFNLGDAQIHALLPAPASQEFVLRCLAPRPTPGSSRPSPQRLYAMLSPEENRIAGAFTEDTMLS